jgi:hypothetical protein
VVGEQNADGALNIIGLGQSPLARRAQGRDHRPASRSRRICAPPCSRPSRWPMWRSAAFTWA